MRLTLTCAAATILATTAWSAEPPAPPKFTARPTATPSTGSGPGKVKIEFAVDRETDVAVFIENGGGPSTGSGQGKIVRHLVAGVLGKNPPPPLKPGLAQSIEWDGKADYGRPAGAGPFRVRVALGLGVKYDKVAIRDEQALNQIKGLAVGPDGTVYLLHTPGSVWRGEQIFAFGRDGKYLRSVMPFPANLGMDRVKGLAAMELRGGVAPVVQSHRLQLFPGAQCPRKTGMAVTPDGKAVLRLTGDESPACIAALGPDGGSPWDKPVGLPLFPPDKKGKSSGEWAGQPAIAVSPDGKWAYVAGCASEKTPCAAIFRVPLPARTPATPFFGSIEKTGKGNALLAGAPRGLACDGRGHLLIADTGNGRVVAVKESDGSFAGEFACERPGLLAADPKTGAVYVAVVRTGKGAVEMVKFSLSTGSGPAGWKDAREVAKLPLRIDGNGSFVMGLDAGAPKPLVWIGTDGGSLFRIEDGGAKFGDAVAVSSRDSYDGNLALDMSVDRFRPDREIYLRGAREWWIRYGEDTGKIERVLTSQNAGLRNGGGGGGQIMAGPDGNIYALWYPYHLFKLDRDAKLLGFTEGGYPESALAKYGKMDKPSPRKGGMWVPANMTEIKHTLGVRADGHVFVFHPPGSGGRPPKALHEYLPTGKKLTADPIVWKVSDGCVGPRFDAAGNIYVAEIVNPGERPYPEEFEKLFGKVEMEKTRPSGVQDEIANMYGSIVKFSPRGGMFHLEGPDPFAGKPKLDGLKTVAAAAYYKSAQRPVKITGAEWLAFGYSHVEVNACVCETTRFDVDEFGRVFYPDLCLYQVRVVDTAGNPILNFGGYGNADSCGPDSRDKALAKPEIAFAWLVGVGVTDKYVYTGDGINSRMLRLKQVYAAEESCAAP